MLPACLSSRIINSHAWYYSNPKGTTATPRLSSTYPNSTQEESNTHSRSEQFAISSRRERAHHNSLFTDGKAGKARGDSRAQSDLPKVTQGIWGKSWMLILTQMSPSPVPSMQKLVQPLLCFGNRRYYSNAAGGGLSMGLQAVGWWYPVKSKHSFCSQFCIVGFTQ